MQDPDPTETPDELFDRIRQEMDEAFERLRRPLEIEGLRPRPAAALEPKNSKDEKSRDEAA